MVLQLEERLLERLRHPLDTGGSVDPVYIILVISEQLQGGGGGKHSKTVFCPYPLDHIVSAKCTIWPKLPVLLSTTTETIETIHGHQPPNTFHYLQLICQLQTLLY